VFGYYFGHFEGFTLLLLITLSWTRLFHYGFFSGYYVSIHDQDPKNFRLARLVFLWFVDH
jgi:hypothetical protein